MCNQGQNDLGLLHAVLCQSFRKTGRNALEEEHGVLEVIEWPAQSPDLNIIQLKPNLSQPTTTEDPRLILQDIWNNLAAQFPQKPCASEFILF